MQIRKGALMTHDPMRVAEALDDKQLDFMLACFTMATAAGQLPKDALDTIAVIVESHKATNKALADAERRNVPKWTTQKPTRAGWYWWRNGERYALAAPVSIFQITDVLCFYPHHGGCLRVSEAGGEWSSQPLAEPEEVSGDAPGMYHIEDDDAAASGE
jgi:hypothetical protein